jgi:hypothetical protein
LVISSAQNPRPGFAEVPDDRTVEGLAQGAGPALGADALLRLSERVTGDARKRRLIEEAFARAAAAQIEFPLVPVPVGFADSVPAMAAISSHAGVDRLSL